MRGRIWKNSIDNFGHGRKLEPEWPTALGIGDAPWESMDLVRAARAVAGGSPPGATAGGVSRGPYSPANDLPPASALAAAKPRPMVRPEGVDKKNQP